MEHLVKTARQVLARIRRRRVRYRALNELDEKLENYLDVDEGFFVEAGANDGLDQSNTAYFEKFRGWRGVLVEPVPRLAARCRANRPRSLVVEAALVDVAFGSPTIRMTDCGLMSSVAGSMHSDVERSEHLRIGSQIQGIEPVDIEVPARTLNSILDEVKPQRFDLLSLDVEGFELQVLRGLDLDRWAPDYVLVEARFREEIDEHMLASGYGVCAVLSHHDVLYRRDCLAEK